MNTEHSAENDAGHYDRRVTALVREVEQFNDLIPLGTPVAYWPGVREGKGVVSTTRSRAWLVGEHTPVVKVEGYAGGIALTHVCPIPPAVSDGGGA